MSERFVDRYIQDMLYIQNPPLDRRAFLKYCEQLGLGRSDQLVEDGAVPALLAFRGEENSQKFLSLSFGNIMDIRPTLRNQVMIDGLASPLFDSAKTVNEESQPKLYFSPFQIILVDRLRGALRHEAEDIKKFVHLTLLLQNVYMPFFRSGGKDIQFHGNDRGWSDRRRSFDLEEAMKTADVDMEFLLNWYKRLSEMCAPLLGIGRSDSHWIELWQKIAWSKKEKLEGNVRRGVDYLQWAHMLKVAIEDHEKREILEVDEISNIAAEDILKFVPEKMDQNGILLRASRNHFYTDPETGINHYHDKYKRLNYLANSFGLEYQPKIILFVEGEIEEKLLPKVFEQYRGSPGFFGVTLKNLHGVETFQSTHADATKLQNLLIDIQKTEHISTISKTKKRQLNQLVRRLQDVDIILSNWEAFINFNLEKWQAIPFFMSDNEGRLPALLRTSKIIKFGEDRYDVPEEWKYIWGVTNDNKPWRGDSFELANFSNEEICSAIKELYGDEVALSEIEQLRENNEALERVIERLKAAQPRKRYRKIKIVEHMLESMFRYYEENDALPTERPVFEAIDRLLQIAALNHAPTTMIGEVDNRKAIIEQMTGELSE